MMAQAFAAAPPEKTFNLDILNGTVAAQQRLVRVDKGDAVRLYLTSDMPGELHLHGYRLAVKLKPGAASEVSFQAYATGRYPFEWHGSADAGKNPRHHAPPLAALEVLPR
ncbi:MAG TPA: hypothetical protein VK663_12120 [Burkholderiales bacterium]|nr:hypothetical protein [Burkholderiales bacterium]